jgi:hypothetical protein
MNVEMAMTLHHKSTLVGWRDVHLPGGWLLDGYDSDRQSLCVVDDQPVGNPKRKV